MKSLFIRYKRYIFFLYTLIFREKIKGLDFTMFDLPSGYSISPEKHLQDIFSQLNVSPRDSFIDIGCGKGFVLQFASKFPFRKIVGLDRQQYLINIARNNIIKLELSDKVELVCDNAIEYSHYDEFNYFYFFNPFFEDVFASVLDNIIRSLETTPRKITIIYYHPTCSELINNSGKFKLRVQLYDNVKDYNTYIYESI